MASNDALLLYSLLRPSAERDGTDPFGFTHPVTAKALSAPGRHTPASGATSGTANSSLSVPRESGHAPIAFIAANELDGAMYTILLEAVTGIDPFQTYTCTSSSSGTSAPAPPFTRTTAVGSVGCLFVTFQVFHLGVPLTPVLQSSASLGPRQTKDPSSVDTEDFPESESARIEEVFDECLATPLSVASLPLDCEVHCRVYNTAQGLVGGCVFHPFSLDGELQSGYRRIPLRHLDNGTGNTAAGGAAGGGESSVLGGGPLEEAFARAPEATEEWEQHMHALHRGTLPAVPWLDAVTRQYGITHVLRGNSTVSRGSCDMGGGTIPGAFLCLHLPVPTRAVPVMSLSNAMDALTGAYAAATSAATDRAAAYYPTCTLPYVDHYRCIKDSNVCEAAAALVARSSFLLYDPSATPGMAERERLSWLAMRPPLQLEPLRLEDVALMWRYGHFAARDPRLFIPFMSSVDWRGLRHASDLDAGGSNRRGDGNDLSEPTDAPMHSAECQAACELIPRWRPLELAQVLGCLSYMFAGVSPVRRHAVRLLSRESDELLCWAAPQLIQALRYDSLDGERELAGLLLARAVHHWELCAVLHWGASVEAAVAGGTAAAQAASPIGTFRQELERALRQSQPAFLARLRRQRDLCGCLRSLHTTLHTVSGDRTSRIVFGQQLLAKQGCGFGELFHCVGTKSNVNAGGVSNGSLSSARVLTTSSATGRHDGTDGASLLSSSGPPCLDAPGSATLPTHPAVSVNGVRAESFYVFKSAKQPMQVGFTAPPSPATRPGSAGNGKGDAGDKASQYSCVFTPLAMTAATTATEVRLMFKMKDDVRQDQLVVQLLHWVDALFRLDGLDLCLTPYRVMATGPLEGLVEVVPDVVTFQSVQRDALRYLRVHNPTSEGLRAAMDRYTRSFAGYCVFTYVLGIGDRHLENILLTKDGRLLHIDFGYILGYDPKPFPPPMKISGEMLEVLGGPEGPGYAEFKTYCCVAYNILRKHAGLLLRLLQLMCHAEGLPQLTGEAAMAGGPGAPLKDGKAAFATPDANLLKVQEKLRLDLSNAQATQYLQNVIADSVGSLFTGLWDVLHAAAQAARA